MNPESEAAPDEPSLPPGWLHIDSLDIEAQGIARRPDGKVVFIDGALTGELVSATVHRRSVRKLLYPPRLVWFVIRWSVSTRVPSPRKLQSSNTATVFVVR